LFLLIKLASWQFPFPAAQIVDPNKQQLINFYIFFALIVRPYLI